MTTITLILAEGGRLDQKWIRRSNEFEEGGRFRITGVYIDIRGSVRMVPGVRWCTLDESSATIILKNSFGDNGGWQCRTQRWSSDNVHVVPYG